MGHGIHVAGIIAARRNGIAWLELPRSRNLQLQCFNFLDSSSLQHYQLYSVGDRSQARHSQHEFWRPAKFTGSKGGLPACIRFRNFAGGRCWEQRQRRGYGRYPAKFDTVIAVSATDENDRIADFSSRGPSVEVAAPGVNILSTITYPMFYELSYDYFSEPPWPVPMWWAWQL